MHPRAINGLMLYVTDVKASLTTYANLGFHVIQDHAPSYGSVRLDNVLIQFQDKHSPDDPGFRSEALAEPKGGGLFLYVQVDDVDEFYQAVIAKGITPTTQPRDWPSGNREFVLRDPDGYKLVFYQAHGAKTLGHEHE